MTIGICPSTLLVDPLGADDDTVRAACDAAAAAGFTTASVWAQHLGAAVASGLTVKVVEAATQWANGDPAAAAAEVRLLASKAAEHRASLIGAACIDPAIADVGRARDHLGALAEAASEAGARLCLEFLPGTAVPDLATAWDYVEPLGDTATVLLDTWHWTRQPGGPAFDVLAKIPGDRIGYVQLCDAAAVAGEDVMVEMMTGRLLPGDGVVDFGAVFAALDQIGAHPYAATEVFNPTLVEKMGLPGLARATRESAERILPGG